MSLADRFKFSVTLTGRDAARMRAVLERTGRSPAALFRGLVRLGYVETMAAIMERQAEIEREAVPTLEAEA